MQVASRITIKGQVTIPKKIREELKVKPKDTILFIKRGNDVVLRPVRTLLDFKGIVKTDKKIDDWEKMRKKAKDYVVRKVMESLK